MKNKIIAFLAVLTLLSGSTVSAEYQQEENFSQDVCEASTVISPENSSEAEEVTAEAVEFEKVSAEFGGSGQISFGADGILLEFEDVYPQLAEYANLVDDSFASGGKFVQCGWLNDSYSGDYDAEFEVTEEGDYSVHFVSAMVRTNMSSISFYIDGTKVAENGNGTSSIHSDTAIECTISQAAGSKYLNDFSMSMHLTEGVHTMTLSMHGPTDAGGRNAFAFDTISIYQPKEITQISAKFDGIVISGDEIVPEVCDQDGNPIDKRNYKSMTFSTDTPSVIKIQGDKVYGRNHGEGNLKVTITTEDNEFEEEIDITVAASDGLYIKSVERDGETVSVTLLAAKDYSGTDSIMVSGYNMKKGLKSLTAATATKKIDALAIDEEVTIQLDVNDLTDDMYANLFIYNGNITTSFKVLTVVNDIQ